MATVKDIARDLATILDKAMREHPQDLAKITTVTLVADGGILIYPVPGEKEPKDGINIGHGFHFVLDDEFSIYSVDLLEEVLALLFPVPTEPSNTPEFVTKSERKVPSDVFYKGVYTYLP